MTKLFTPMQYDLLSTLSVQALFEHTNLRTGFNPKVKTMPFKDAPLDTLLVVTNVLASGRSKPFDVTGGHLLSGSVIVHLSEEMANVIAWSTAQSLQTKETLLYMDVAFLAQPSSLNPKLDFYRVHRKVLPMHAHNVVGNVSLLSDLVYSGEPFAPDVKFTLEALGIKG